MNITWKEVAIIGLFFGFVVAMTLIFSKNAHSADREPCTWDIQFYALGKKLHGKSDHAWHLTKDEQAQLFGPFVAGALFVVPGAASFTCAGKTTTILTAPLPQGSLTELK